MSDSDDFETSYELVMPFVVCQSNGGPYDDKAFTAGWACGWVDTALASLPAEANRYGLFHGVPAALVPQLDLVGMHRGFTLTARPFGDDDSFVFVTFERTGGEVSTTRSNQE